MNKNVTAVLLIVLAIGVYVTFTSAKWNEVKAVQAFNNQYSQAIANSDRLIQVRDQVLKDYNALSADDKDRLDKMLPSSLDNIRLLIDMNNFAARRGLVLKSIKVSSSVAPLPGAVPVAPIAPANGLGGVVPAPMPTISTVMLSFGVSTTYSQFISFMRDLEANLRIMDVTHLSVAANDTGVYDYSVELKTYWLSQ